jgi:two-component system, NarL family, sensor histidine kinase UhpB
MKILYAYKNSLFCLLMSLLLFTSVYAQQKPDWDKLTNVKERVDSMRKYSVNLIRKQQFDEAIPLIHTTFIIAQQASLDSAAGASLFLLGSAYRYKSRFDSAFYFLQKSREIALGKKIFPLLAMVETESYGIYNKLGKADSAAAALNQFKDLLPVLDSNSTVAARIQLYLGHNDKHQVKYTDALTHYYKALRTFIYLKDSLNEGLIYVSIANVQATLGFGDKALSFHQQAAALFNKLHRRTELLNELLNITDMYYTSERLDSAEASVKRALPIAEEINDKNSVGYVYLNLGNIYKRRKKYPEAEAYLLKSAGMADSLDNVSLKLEVIQGLGELYMAQKQFAKAKPFFEKHLAIAKQEKSLEEITEALWNLSETEYGLHNYAKAYEYKNLYSNYRDSSFKESSAKSIAEMEAKYQGEKKEKEIALLKKDQELDHLSLQKQKNFQIGAIVFLLLLVLIAFLIVNRYRIVQRTKRLIEMEKMRNSLARDLHDDIGSTLTSINILSKMALQQPAGADVMMHSNMQKIKDRSSAIMESVSDIVWAINPQNDTTEQMIFRMKEFTAEILEPLNINYTFKEQGDFSSLKLDIKKRKDFYLLFKEAINNAAKYSHCKNLVIELNQDDISMHLSVQDDGTGFNTAEIKNGNGLRNMRERAASMGAKINIDTALGKGTGIIVDAPIT